MKNFLLLILTFLISNSSFSQECENLIISEILYGWSQSSTSKGNVLDVAVEIYNPTDNLIDLSQYKIEILGESSEISELGITGNIGSGEAFVLANPKSSSEVLSVADFLSDGLEFQDKTIIQLVSGNEVIDRFGRQGVATDITDIDWELFVNDPEYRNSIILNVGSLKNWGLRRDGLVRTGTVEFVNSDILTKWNINFAFDKDNLGIHKNSCLYPFIFWDLTNPLPDYFEYEVEALENTGFTTFGTIKSTEILTGNVTIELWQNEVDLQHPDSPFSPNALKDIDYTSPHDINQNIVLNSGANEWQTELFTPKDDCDEELNKGAGFLISSIVDDGGTGAELSMGKIYFSFLIVDNPCLSTEFLEPSDIKLEIHPTIVQNLVKISSLDPSLKIQKVELYDLLGSEVFQQEVEQLSNVDINIDENLGHGFYFMLIYTDAGIVKKKILKM